jgi:ABC-2 type transport system ATP-binding protein
MIQVEGLTKDYGARRAIESLTFDARQGEILGFLGPNGAGKTTTMRILTGYMPPTNGKATVAGYDVVEHSLDVRRRVGYMPESVPLYPDMTVFDYLKFMADLRRVQNPEERIDELLERLNMTDRSESHIGSLSKGMRQRVGLAQALVHNPEVLILDEPTIGLDPGQIIEVRHLIKELGNQHTVLLSTHILSEAQQVCDRVLIINRGRIVAEDTPQRLQDRLAGARRLAFQVGGDADGVERVVSAVPGVTSVAGKEAGRFEIETQAGVDPRPEVARALIQAGFDLLELRPVGVSLEDIFLQLTRDEPSQPEMAEAEALEEEEIAPVEEIDED